MSFADLFFLYIFLPICLICYFATKNIRYRNIVLIVFSLLFYAWGEPFWIILLLAATAVNYMLGKLITKEIKLSHGEDGEEDGPTAAKARTAMAIGVIYNIGVLVVFKYTGFFIRNFNALFKTSIAVPAFTAFTMLGMSFYTFRAVSYILDCYWEKIDAEQHFPNFLLFMTLFPQVTQGPIVRYRTIGKELTDRTTTAEDISAGATRIVMGLAKKVILADNLGTVVSSLLGVTDIKTISVFGTWLGALLYALQIYFDFAGYSDIAIGLGRIFGFHFEENFDQPFTCRTIAEFWQKWHISLGTWFRDYLLYVPIFGKRIATLNLFIVWFCTGFWHGASWNYIIWGLYFGLFIFLEQLIGKKRLAKVPEWVLHIYTKIVLIIGFGIFYCTDTSLLGNFMKNLFGFNGNGLFDSTSGTILVNNIFLILVSIALCIPFTEKVKSLMMKKLGDVKGTYVIGGIRLCWCVLLLLVCTVLLVNATNHPFLYVQF